MRSERREERSDEALQILRFHFASLLYFCYQLLLCDERVMLPYITLLLLKTPLFLVTARGNEKRSIRQPPQKKLEFLVTSII